MLTITGTKLMAGAMNMTGNSALADAQGSPDFDVTQTFAGATQAGTFTVAKRFWWWFVIVGFSQEAPDPIQHHPAQKSGAGQVAAHMRPSIIVIPVQGQIQPGENARPLQQGDGATGA